MSDSTKTWPQRIWLQGCPDDATPPPFDQVNDGDVTWCADHISSSDVEYIRSDLAASSAKTAEVLVTDAVYHSGDRDVTTADLLDESAEMLTDYAATQRDLGHDSTAAGADAHAYRLRHLAITRAQAVSLPAEPEKPKYTKEWCLRMGRLEAEFEDGTAPDSAPVQTKE